MARVLAERGPREWDSDHISPPLCRLEKEYAAMKSKEMEEQIEIKVSPQGGGGQGRGPLGGAAGPQPRTSLSSESEPSSLRSPAPSFTSRPACEQGPMSVLETPPPSAGVANKVDRSLPS